MTNSYHDMEYVDDLSINTGNPPRLIRTAAPNLYPISIVEMKSHCNITHSDDDALLDQIRAGIIEYLDGADGILDRCFTIQSFDMHMDRFPAREISIPCPPLITLDAIKWVDDQGNIQTMDAADYQLVLGGKWRSRVIPAFGKCWPCPRYQEDSVLVQFTAGYEEGRLPEPIRRALYTISSHWYENREAYTDQAFNWKEVPTIAWDLLANFRRMAV